MNTTGKVTSNHCNLINFLLLRHVEGIVNKTGLEHAASQHPYVVGL